jgi:hypothetical protein
MGYVVAAKHDFQATRLMRFSELPGASQKSDRFVFASCGCRVPRLSRAHRSLWMRLLPVLRLYKCGVCCAKVLRTPLANVNSYPVSYPITHGRGRKVITSPRTEGRPIVQLVVGSSLNDAQALLDHLKATPRH